MSKSGDYCKLKMHGHPRADRDGNVLEHIVVAELALGKPMPQGAHVHHVDGNGHNNANANLVICQDAAYHKLLHTRARVVRAGGNPNIEKVCSTCKRLVLFSGFNRAAKRAGFGYQTACRECQSAYQATYQRGAA